MGILKRNVPPKPGRASVSIIAKGNSLSGDIKITGKTHIDGSIHGHILAEEDISIGKYGHLKGRIRGKRIFVSGSLEGEVVCDHLFIEPGGQVHAQVCCGDMKIDQGGVFVGERTLPEAMQGVNPLELSQHTSELSENPDQGDIFTSLPERITLSGKS
jgi:cytoskeletal protein CcmA (bactofilin family)